MALREFKLPDPGEGLTEAEIVTWHVAPGDTVKVNDIVVEIETAKSLVELPVPFAGTIGELLVSEGDTVEVGTPILHVDDGKDDGSSPAPTARPAAAAGDDAASGGGGATGGDSAASGGGGAGGSGGSMSGRTAVLVGYGVKQTEARRRPRTTQPGPDSTKASVPVREEAQTGARVRALAKPPVRKLAKDLGVDLVSVTPTGEGGVVTRADVEAAASTAAESAPRVSRAAASVDRGETRLPVKGVRKMTAQAMVASAFTAPHVTEWVEVDVTATMELVETLRRDREFRDVKVTPMTVLAKAMCLAVRRHPEVNATWDEAAQEIVVKHYVNLGFAAATPRGLVVPNVKDADRMDLVELAGAIAELTTTARDGRLQPSEMAGGTITITNVGVFGVDGGTPILNPGESAILAFGSVTRKPWVVGEGTEERIEPRWVTTLALSFDHRLVDGELGSRFLATVAGLMSDPARALVWG
jgi:2-oxoisovalerate dehydrogenase E2 component (dihydrolipoyl transacylase)